MSSDFSQQIFQDHIVEHAVGQLAGGVAHDFNNLLPVITGSVDLLRRDGLTDERKDRFLDAISETANRAAKLTSQLLSFARRQPLKPELFSAGERLQGIAAMLQMIAGSQTEVETRVEPDTWGVCADPNQFETAIVNMAVNARDAMPEGGLLTLMARNVEGVPAIRSHLAAPGDFVAISVTDTDSGMSPDTIVRIFEPFFTTKEVGKGTGLGLSQVHGFAKQSNGNIGVESQLNSGTTFTLYLPRSDLIAEAPTIIEPPREISDYSGDRGVILVVENNQLVGEFAVQFLEELGYETTWAQNALAALKCLGSRRFDLMFTDIVMPGMSGIELAKKVREEIPGMPVILTSGYSDVLAEHGTDGFPLLHKPYSAVNLAHALRQALVKAD